MSECKSLLDDREARFARVIVAADAFTRYTDDADAFHALCSACEGITDAELDVLRREYGEFGDGR